MPRKTVEEMKTTWKEFFALYDSSQITNEEALIQTLHEKIGKFNPTGFMIVLCEQFDSINGGRRWILPFGPHNTFTEVRPNEIIHPLGLASDSSFTEAWIEASEVPLHAGV